MLPCERIALQAFQFAQLIVALSTAVPPNGRRRRRRGPIADGNGAAPMRHSRLLRRCHGVVAARRAAGCQVTRGADSHVGYGEHRWSERAPPLTEKTRQVNALIVHYSRSSYRLFRFFSLVLLVRSLTLPRARGPAGDQFVATPCGGDERPIALLIAFLIALLMGRPASPHSPGLCGRRSMSLDVPRSTSASFPHQ